MAPISTGPRGTGTCSLPAKKVILTKKSDPQSSGITYASLEWGDRTMPKIDLNRVSMPKQEPLVRAKNFNEVALGYAAENALYEAGRCFQCQKRPCVECCPVGVDIPEFI